MKRFSYRRDNSAWLQAALPFLAVILLEIGLGVAVILRVTRPGPRIALLAVLLGLGTFVSVLILAPLFGSHRLESDQLRLRYGIYRFRLPLDWIDELRRSDIKLPMAQPLTVRLDARSKRLLAAFSERGLMEAKLTGPRDFAAWPARRWRGVEAVVFNVDQPELLLQEWERRRKVPAPGPAPLFEPEPMPPRPIHWEPDAETPAVEAEGLWLRYGDGWVVRDLSLRVAPGQLYGFVGANGAGKTTTLKMMAGILRPQKGDVRICGSEVWPEGLRARENLGYAPDEPVLYDRLSGRECLLFLSQLRGLSRKEADRAADSAIELLGLESVADDLSGSYSLGFRKRLTLAASLLGRPRALLLDEPLNGLDPLSAARLKDLMRRLCRQRRVAVLFSSHDLAAVESICDRIGIIDRGCLVAEGAASDLLSMSGAADLETAFLRFVRTGGEAR